ncbi:hypothetical protein NIES4075_57120 [Tolypothrix sp. NIES-4075]|uniref:hypothetical protein n=1 Tax=Tolypothrix sp. NIES-4075 TaxID=2005459 RepID=UPI000B68D3EB|nr:hypothetical protein [Tolypothrix sp. NIES-4075]GAX44693.1 hypothetical protein NIES4075_57120 [Tolypothrix sp. NIES-4075]
MRCLICGSEDFYVDNSSYYRCSKCWSYPPDEEEDSEWGDCFGCGLYSNFLDEEGYCANCNAVEPYDRDPHDPRNDGFGLDI